MTGEILMPRLSEQMEQGTILEWLKSVGDELVLGEPLVEIETDKASMVYESEVAGTVAELLVGEDETAAVGEVIARVALVGGQDREEPRSVDAGESNSLAARDGGSGDDGGARSPSTMQKVKASPIARRIARETGIDLRALVGSGPGGRIGRKDVERALSAQPADALPAAASTGAPGPGGISEGGSGTQVGGAAVGAGHDSPASAKGATEVVELTRLQQTVARRMAESKATTPHFHITTEVDMSRAVESRSRVKALARGGEVVPSLNDMVVKACALALREFPRANGTYRDGHLELYSRVNVGIAVAASEALVVPTIFDADKKGLRQIAIEARALAERVRDDVITPPELAGGTFTVSNLGMYGIKQFAPVINPPQAGILGAGAISPRPGFHEGAVVSVEAMELTLACDHRILYGADAAEFLGFIRRLLEEPLELAR